MKQCPACKREIDDQTEFCPFDGQPLTTKATDPLLATTIDDKYRLDSCVGEGGMGCVYRATHVQMENTVAVKVLHSHLSSDQTAVERFRREARAAAQIRHPNAVAVTDFGVTKDKNIAYLVMEFLEGEDLRQKLKRQKRLDYEEVALILRQTCAAVTAAHTKGIIHRDLKPDNILLLGSGEDIQVKVLDFGIAKLKAVDANTLTQKGMIVGTPYYMSPEQCRGEELDARSDIYSLGIILYEMLTGKVPFEGSTPLAVVLKHNSEAPRPLSELRMDIPQAVENVVLKAISKKREDRQSSAIQLAQEFESALISSGVSLASLGTLASPTYSIGGALTESGQRQDTNIVNHPTRAFGAGITRAVDSVQDKTVAMTSQPEKGGQEVQATKQAFAKAPKDTAVVSAEVDSSIAPKKKGILIYVVAAVVVLGVVAAVLFIVLRPKPVPINNHGLPTAPPNMVLVPGGTFKMGTDDAKARDEWKPAHDVTLKDFYIDEFEVTNEEYFRFVRDKGYPAPSNWANGSFPPGEAKLPVTGVTWYDANAYAEWAGKRLPTEAEWEHAARGPNGFLYPWGNSFSQNLSNSAEDKRGRPVGVGSYPGGTSPYGVYDMAGNVAEWVADDYQPYPKSPAAPLTDNNPLKGMKVYRGGAYSFPSDQLVTYIRWVDYPNTKQPYLGFRCAKDVPPKPAASN